MRIGLSALASCTPQIDPNTGVDVSGCTDAIYDPATGIYIGGSPWMDFWCSTIGSLTGDPQCAIPTTAQIRQQQINELDTTGMSPANQAAAVAAADAILAAGCAQNPSQGAAQNAAALHPQLSAMIGPGTVAAIYGINCDGSIDPTKSLLPWIIAAVVGVGMIVLLKK
jgi:hypothetical protein